MSRHMLRDVDNLDCAPEFHRLNFEPIFYRDEYCSPKAGRYPASNEKAAYPVEKNEEKDKRLSLW